MCFFSITSEQGGMRCPCSSGGNCAHIVLAVVAAAGSSTCNLPRNVTMFVLLALKVFAIFAAVSGT
jgi:hypothetical protein